MTQEANDKSVLGVFDGRDLHYWGRTVRPVKRNGRFRFDYLDPVTGRIQVSLPVLRSVGSHRYQQYLTQTPGGGETFYRLHMRWHMETQRWVHVNGAFLSPDEQDYDAHIAVWNHNCIFCHNTGPLPNIVNYAEMGQRERRGEAINSAMEAQYAAGRGTIVESVQRAWTALHKSQLPSPAAGALLDTNYVLDETAAQRLIAIGHAAEKQDDIGE